MPAGGRYRWMVAVNGAVLLAPPLVLAFSNDTLKLGPWVPFYSFLLSALTLTLAALLVRTWRALFLLHLPLLALAPFFVWYVFYFSAPPDEDAFTVLLTSPPEEFRSFVELFHLQAPLLSCLAALLMYVGIAMGLRNQQIPPAMRRMVLWSALPLLALLLCMPTRSERGVSIDVGETVSTYLTSSYPLGGVISLIGGLHGTAEAWGLFEHKEKYGARPTFSDEAPRTHILVIGESARADHFQILGYQRQTTPELARMSGLLVFSQTYSTANLTSLAVPMLMTGSAPASYSPQNIHGNLVDVANEAGYFTAWLSNQSVSLYKLFRPQPQIWRQPVDVGNWSEHHATPDDVLLAPLDEMLKGASPRKFIVMHTYGSHANYADRLPDDGFHFSGRDRPSVVDAMKADRSGRVAIDVYDDTILHTDFLLQQIVERASRLPGQVTVTYVPDHGEALQAEDGRATHGFKEFSVSELHIPLLVWANAEFRQSHAKQWEAMRSHQDLVVGQDAVFHTVASLLDIEFPAQDPSRDLTAKAFRPVPIHALKFRIAGPAAPRSLRDAQDWARVCKTLNACG